MKRVVSVGEKRKEGMGVGLRWWLTDVLIDREGRKRPQLRRQVTGISGVDHLLMKRLAPP